MTNIDIKILKAREIFKSIEEDCKNNGIKYTTPYQVKDYIKFKSPYESPLDFNEREFNRIDYLSIISIISAIFSLVNGFFNNDSLYLIGSCVLFLFSIILFLYSLNTKKILKKEKYIYKKIIEGTKLVETVHLKNIDWNELNEDDYFLNCKICSLLYREVNSKKFDFESKQKLLKELNKEYKDFDKNQESKIISKKAINGLSLYKNIIK